MYEARKRLEEYRQLCKERVLAALEAYEKAQEAQKEAAGSSESDCRQEEITEER